MLFRHCCSYRQFFHELCFKTIKAPLLCPFFRKHSLDNSSFLEEVSSLSHSIIFLYSLHCSCEKSLLSLLGVVQNSVQLDISFLFSLAFLLLFFPQLFVKPPRITTLPSFISFSLGCFGHCLLYNVKNFYLQLLRHSVYQI